VDISHEDIELIVEPHTVIANIYSSIHGEDFLNFFLKLHKFKINTLECGLCISSYEQSIPKLLSSRKGEVVNDDDSYLDKKAWDDFDHIETVWKTEFERCLLHLSNSD